MAWIIDADTHVDESEATWRELQGSLAKYVPVTVTPPAESLPQGAIDPARSRWWFVEGRLQARAIRDNVHHPHRDKRELKDVPGRLEDMDRMDVRAQVIFPTFFIRYNTANAEAEQALTKAYNRWIAERCAASGGRLHWAAMLPLLDADESVKELRWAKDHGACGFFKRGYDLDRQVSDPHFFPVYEEAASLDLPVCIHTGHPLPGHEWDRGFPVMAAFTAVVTAKLPERFPKLRFGFIEAGASWIPYTDCATGDPAAFPPAARTRRVPGPDQGPVPHQPAVRRPGPGGRHRVPAHLWYRGQPDYRHRLLPLRSVGQPGRVGRGTKVGR